MTRGQALKALELHDGASFQEIKQAYRDLALVWHPDRFAHNTRLQQKGSERFKEINAAYAVLRAYDDGPSRPMNQGKSRPGSTGGSPGTEQSGTQRQRSRTENRSTRGPWQNSNKQEQSVHRPSPRAWVVLACLLFLAVIAGSLDERTVPDRQGAAHQAQPVRPSIPIGETGETTTLADSESDPAGEGPHDALQRDLIELGSLAVSLLEEAGSSVLEKLEEVGSSAADEAASPHVEPGADSTAGSEGDPAGEGPHDALQRELIELGSLSVSLLEKAGSSVLEKLEEVGSSAADEAASPHVGSGTDSTDPVLAVREPESAASGESNLYFTRGSHRDDVLRIQGTPSSINRYTDHEVFRYGLSTINISLRDRRVTGWSNTSGNLRVRMEPGPDATRDSDAATRPSADSETTSATANVR